MTQTTLQDVASASRIVSLLKEASDIAGDLRPRLQGMVMAVDPTAVTERPPVDADKQLTSLEAQVARMQEGFSEEMKQKELENDDLKQELSRLREEVLRLTRCVQEKDESSEGMRREALCIEERRAAAAEDARKIKSQNIELQEKLSFAQQQLVAIQPASQQAPLDVTATPSSTVGETVRRWMTAPANDGSGEPELGVVSNTDDEDGFFLESPMHRVELLFDKSAAVLGIDFLEPIRAPFVVTNVLETSCASGVVVPGDELAFVAENSTRSMDWDTLQDSLRVRPVALTFTRGCNVKQLQASTSRQEFADEPEKPATFRKTAERVSALGSWTSRFAKSAVAAVGSAAAATMDALETVDKNEQMDVRQVRPTGEYLEAEELNEPFYRLVEDSAADALFGGSSSADDPVEDGIVFEKWLRNFHSEKDDTWYQENHMRLLRAFRPIWDKAKARGPPVTKPAVI